MSLLVLGLVLFIGVHSVSIVSHQWRDAAATRLGEGVWKLLYSIVAVCGLVLIVAGYGMARQDPSVLYVPPEWLRHLSMLLLVFVFPMVLAAYLPGRIQTTLKHPLLVAVKTWALAHLLVNGTVADVVLFGVLLVWAVADRISLKRRPARPAPSLPWTKANDVVAVVGGLGIYLALVMGGHQWLFGVGVAT
ncbi:NnrU family protein [Thiohalorhabdus sp.]|uniref:NnrU family protein n=1 Tax=Thiohalorhabdus sp. TaxID=3094134 RepID=UPI002FC2B873